MKRIKQYKFIINFFHFLKTFPKLINDSLWARIEISDISADILAIYRISGLIETIFDTENRLQEKSRKIGEYRRYFGEISDFDRNIGRNIGCWETRARGNFFGFFWEIYRRYIGNISKISEIYRKYR